MSIRNGTSENRMTAKRETARVCVDICTRVLNAAERQNAGFEARMTAMLIRDEICKRFALNERGAA